MYIFFRLKKTWSLLSRRDKQTFDRLYDLFSEEANFEELRKHVDQLAFSPVKDCIPYLGIYLTDLTYIGKFHLFSFSKEYFPNLLETGRLPRFFVYRVRDFKFWLLAYFFISFNPIPTGLGHVTLIYGLIPPMAGRNRVNRAKFQQDITTLILDIFSLYKSPTVLSSKPIVKMSKKKGALKIEKS